MPHRIQVLDEKVINRIAAGEVVERPVSVVKELIENSIDAEARRIEVDIENGGKKLIRVRDDGHGMNRDDAFLAVERHATSKIQSEKDLTSVATMGFRGEALASIASVSKLKLITFDGEDPAGIDLTIEGGVLKKPVEVGIAQGTTVEVRNLFFNIPVRRKFLKGIKTESGHIHELVTRMALAHPSIGFVFREDGRLKMDAPATQSTMDRIAVLFSRDVRESLVTVDYSIEDYRIHGYVVRPPYARSNRRSVQTFVNGRSVQDRLVMGAVSRGFANLIERGRYPLAILFVELPPEDVDVNVHPQKAEVRFVKPDVVHELILDGVFEALTGGPFRIPRGAAYSDRPRRPTDSPEKHFKDKDGREPESQAPVPYSEAPSGPSPEPLHRTDPPPTAPETIPEPVSDESAGAHAPPVTPEPHYRKESTAPVREPTTERVPFTSLGIVGTIPGSFVVLYDESRLLILDHHAAHERILFEDLKKADESGEAFESQDLLIPTLLEYSPVEARTFAKHLTLLNRVGFRIEEFGQNDFLVKGVPGWLESGDHNKFFESLIETMLETGVRGDTGALRDDLLKDMACKAAVKESGNMEHSEIRALLNDLDRIGSIDVCPHGRPILTSVPLREIRKKLGRK